jgi:hypothetical protein
MHEFGWKAGRKERDHYEDLDVGRRIILLIWLRIGTSGGLL